jgi:hypothetical protein
LHQGVGRVRSSAQGPRRQPCVRPHVRRRRRGAAAHRALRRFHKTVLRTQSLTQSGLDLVRVQGQCRDLFTGKVVFYSSWKMNFKIVLVSSHLDFLLWSDHEPK